MAKKLVSAIVSTYNSERFFKQKLEDLLSQTIINDTEIIVVNSGSKQNEDFIIKEFLNVYDNIKYIRTEKRETIYSAWNRGIKISEGEFITNSNTDDRLRKDAFEILSGTLIRNPQAALVYADQYITSIPNHTFDQVVGSRVFKFPDFNMFLQLARCLAGSQPMWRSSLHFKDNYWFNEKYEICGDHEFELRISEKYKLMHITEILGTFYKDYKDKGNKEYQNYKRTVEEGNEISYNNIIKYINKTPVDDLKKEYDTFKYWTSLPFLLYPLNAKLRKFLNPEEFFYSVDFIYLVTGLLFIKEGKLKNASSLFTKLLRYKKSEWIEREYLNLQKMMRSNEAQ